MVLAEGFAPGPEDPKMSVKWNRRTAALPLRMSVKVVDEKTDCEEYWMEKMAERRW